MFKYLKVIVKCLPSLVWAYFAWMIKYSKAPEKYDIKLRYEKVQKLVRKVLRAFNVTLNEINLVDFNDYKGENNRFIVANHLSDADPLIFLAFSDRPISFVAKKEILKYPFIGKVIKILNGEFIDRGDLKKQLISFKNIQNKANANKGCDWVIFPEGTRNKTDVKEVKDFHYGSFKPAMKNKMEIYDFSIMGSQRILSSKIKDRKYIVSIKLNKVFTPEYYENMSTIDLSKEAHDATQDGVTELIPIDEDLRIKFNKAR